jgi:hypothetical protein
MVVASTAESYNLEELSVSFTSKWAYRELDISEDIEDNVIPYEAGDSSGNLKRVFFFRCDLLALTRSPHLLLIAFPALLFPFTGTTEKDRSPVGTWKQ